jgi:hypothetical protein
VPRGIVSSVFWSALVGWIMICAITLAIPDLATAAAQGWNMFFATMDAILPNGLKLALYFFILITQLLCGLATVTSAAGCSSPSRAMTGFPASPRLWPACRRSTGPR